MFHAVDGFQQKTSGGVGDFGSASQGAGAFGASNKSPFGSGMAFGSNSAGWFSVVANMVHAHHF